jgi:alkyldihydroxyacetonephosphate synthase
MHSVTNSAQRRLARVQAHVTANPTFSSNTTATTTTTTTTNTNTTTSNNTRTVSPTKTSSTAETNSPEDKSKDALKLRGWGYNDTHFFLNEDNQVELSGNRYPQAFPPNVKRVFPKLKEFMEDRLHMNVDETSFITEQLPSIDPPILNHAFVAGVQKLLPKVELYSDHRCRLRHGLGCTMEEVWSIRYAKKIGRVPDLVMYPKSHNEVEIIVKEAVEHDAVIIPYGGGTTVSGALQCPTNEVRCIVSLDMSRMCRIKWVDRENMTACIEAGTIGTEIERKLGNVGFIMGHEPDSYEHSTMGGWIATNASGMKKNVFGNIEDIVVNFKVVTPTGTMECGGNFPRVSAGPNIMNLIFGSEGTLGVVTEAVVRIRRVPESVVYGSAIFYNFHQGIQAMREVARQRCQPASIRLVDNEQFRLAQVFKPESATPTKDGYMSAIQQAYVIKYKGFDEHKMVAMTLLFQGANRRETRLQEKKVYDIVKQYGGMAGDATNGIRGYFLT